MKIVVRDNPNTGSCSVVDHFQRNWNKETLHPKAGALEVEYLDNDLADSVEVIDNGLVLLEFKDAQALRLDLIQEAIISL